MKNRYVAAALAFFLGGLGIHRFYLGKWNGILYLLFCWTYIPSLIAFVECILFLVNGEDSFNEKYNKNAMNQYDYTPQNNNERGNSIPNTSISTNNSIICPKCGHKNEATSNFCESCGQKLN